MIMKKYKNLNELIDNINKIEYEAADIRDRKSLVHIPIINKMMEDMLAKDSSYRFHFLTNVPVIGSFLMNRRINEYIRWIDSIFTDSLRLKYKEDMEEELKNHRNELMEVYELLDDDSKCLLLDLICLRLTGDFNYIVSDLANNDQYLSEKIKWKNNLNIVDAGGYIGDTLLSFLKNGIIPNNYYVYELEDTNYKRLLKNARRVSKSGVNVFTRQKGVYSRNGKLYFIADSDSSKIVDYETKDSIDVVTIDSDVNGKIDFIKMDIEGSEVEALKGASEVIRQYAPTLAICIYHKKDDFWKIPLLIKEINSNYKRYWIEHYQIGYNETVLYVSL